MRKLVVFLVLFLTVQSLSAQGFQPIRRGSLGIATGIFNNRSEVEGVEIRKITPFVGTQLDFDFNKVNIGLGMNFLLANEGDNFFQKLKSPDFGVKLAFSPVHFYSSSLHFGARFGLRTGIYESSQLPKPSPNPDVQNKGENQSSYYTGPMMSYRYRLPIRKMKQGYLTITTELSYLYGLGTFHSGTENFESRVDDDKKLFQQGLNLTLIIGWGSDI